MNKKYFIVYLSVIFILSASKLHPQELPDWNNPKVFGINKLGARADFFPFESEELAVKNNKADSKWFISLNGNWKFKWSENPSQRPVEFFRTDFNADTWKEIVVPGNWQLEGFGSTIGSDKIFPDTIPVQERYNPVGSYRKTITLPNNWIGRKIYIYFGSVRSAFYLWINGEKIGYSEGSGLPAEFDITNYIKSGDNVIALEVYQKSDGALIDGPFKPELSGIEREVYLYARPNLQIRDFYVATDLTNNYKDGILNMEVDVSNLNPLKEITHLEIYLKRGRKFYSKKHKFLLEGSRKLDYQFLVPEVTLWSAEDPALFSLIINLIDEGGNIQESISTYIGFRKIELNNGQLFVNGKAIYIKGINRQEHDRENGNYISRETMLKDIELLKKANVNAVRNDRYPNDPLWYELCDEYGLYVLDEANTGPFNIGNENNTINKSDWRKANQDRITRMVERDKNFTSVILWSLGKMPMDKFSFESTSSLIGQIDHTRPVLYATNELNTFAGIISPVFPKIDQIGNYTTNNPNHPLIISQYSYDKDNIEESLKDYWSAIEINKALQGGFISNWEEQEPSPLLSKEAQFNTDNNDSLQNSSSEAFIFCNQGIVNHDRSPKPVYSDIKKIYQNIAVQDINLKTGQIKIINKHFFTDLSDYQISWNIKSDGKILLYGTLPQESIPARSEKTIRLDFTNLRLNPGQEYFLNIILSTREKNGLIPAGYEMAREEIKIQNK